MYHGPGDVRFEEVPEPVPGPGDLLVEVGSVGICGSDAGEYVHEPHFFPIAERHPFSGHQGPTIPGHEFSGRVIAVGDGVEGFRIGDLVASGAGVSCGTCDQCLRGRTNMCRNYWTVGLHAHGAMAEQVKVPAMCCLNLSDRSITPDVAALAQPMAIAVHASRRGRIGPDDVVLVIGAGGIGSFLTFATAATGATVVATDIDPAKLAIASELGAAATVDAAPGDELGDRLIGAAGPPTLVFECTATPGCLQLAVETVADNGRVVVVGHQPAPVAIPFKQVSFGEKELIGTMAQAFAADFAPAVDLVTKQPEVWEKVAPTVFPIEEFLTAGLIPMTERRATQIKTLFDPSLDTPRPLRINP